MSAHPAAEPEHIAISKSTGIKIDWKDGHQSDYTVEYLRLECPCAHCAGTHGTVPLKEQLKTQPKELFPMYRERLKILSVEPVGSYALKINWSDGHNSGIYSWDYLRRICPSRPLAC